MTDGVIGIGVLGAVILGAIGVAKLITIKDLVIKEVIKDIQEVKGVTTTTNSPLMVRGESPMTAFATDSNKWQPGTIANSFCTVVNDATYIDLNGATITPPASVPWVIDLYGHLPKDNGGKHRGDPSTNGIELQGASTPCNGDGTSSVTIVYFGNSNFYPEDLHSTAKNTGNKRFWDMSTDCQGEPNKDGTGDRDLCERMAAVYVFQHAAPPAKPPMPLPAGTKPDLSCVDGDCYLGVGKP